MKKVCIFGIYNPALALNQVLIKGFSRNGYEVIECRVDPKVGSLKKYVLLWKKAREMKHEKFSYIVVGVPGQAVVWIAKLIFGGVIILDACHSIYDANVIDRKHYSKYSLRGTRDWFFDWHSVRVADVVLLHTEGTINYFVETFGAKREKCHVLYTGADEEIFYPREAEHPHREKFYVHFHAVFTPVQGVENILDAAEALRGESVHFHICGYGGLLYEKIESRVKKNLHDMVTLEGKVDHGRELPEYLARADVCIGTFGDTPKARFMSVPTKVFEYIAMKKPVIAGDTEAMRELFTDRENILFAELGNGKDLAEKILSLRADENLQNKIAENSYKLFTENLTFSAIVRGLLEELPERV